MSTRLVRTCRRSLRYLVACALCLPVHSAMVGTVWADTLEPSARSAALQAVVDQIKHELSIDANVIVHTAIVEADPLLVSVRPMNSDDGTTMFLMSFDETFLSELDDDGLTAVIAHELGHVWIFTHHPYLQTERLANAVAMRIVTRDSLARVYAKVWQQKGTKGDLISFLGK